MLSLSDGSVSVDTVGILYALGAGVSYSAYTLIIKGMLEKLPPNAIMAAVVCLAGVILSPILADVDPQWLWQPRSIIVILHLGIISMAVSYWFFARGLATVLFRVQRPCRWRNRLQLRYWVLSSLVNR